MDNPKTKLADRIKETNNVLVTVSANPSVDQLAAAIGLTLLLTKLNKHATAVFSGEVPSTIEFLKPEETLESNTDSLRDFIIALDKNKADKLRYKVEDKMVKIFITPYRTSIGEEDLEFSEGDFNVDIVIALGVRTKEDVDQAITSHGRILHDATVATLNTTDGSELGGLNWTDPKASSLCEMIVALADLLKANTLDEQIATALLTGIVAETERFSNAKTTSVTMSASAKLMGAGANQQLVATKLQEGQVTPQKPIGKQREDTKDEPTDAVAQSDGSLLIDHAEDENKSKKPIEQIKIDKEGDIQPQRPVELPPPPPPPKPPAPPPKPPEPPKPHVEPDHRKFLAEPPHIHTSEPSPEEGGTNLPKDESKLVLEPPAMGGRLSAAASDNDFEPSMDQLTLPPVRPTLLHHDSAQKQETTPVKPAPPPIPEEKPMPVPPPEPPTPSFEPPPPPPPVTQQPAKLSQAAIDVMDDQTLDSIEGAVDSRHQLLKNADKTLKTIEETVDSPHLDYEPHESEPAELPGGGGPFKPIALPEPPKPSPSPKSNPEPPTPPPKTEPESLSPKDEKLDRGSSGTDAARQAVEAAINAGGDGRDSLPALQSVGATNIGLDLGHQPQTEPAKPIHIDPHTGMLSYPDELVPGGSPPPPAADPGAPPPVPPPMMPPPPSA